MGVLHVTAARVKTEKSKRKPGISAHVAVDIKPAAVHAAMIRSKEAASRTLLGLCNPRRLSISHLFPSPPFPAAASRCGEGRGADWTVKYWVNLNQRDRALDGAGMSGYNVDLSCSPVRVCETKLKPKIALREEKCR